MRIALNATNKYNVITTKRIPRPPRQSVRWTGYHHEATCTPGSLTCATNVTLILPTSECVATLTLLSQSKYGRQLSSFTIVVVVVVVNYKLTV